MGTFPLLLNPTPTTRNGTPVFSLQHKGNEGLESSSTSKSSGTLSRRLKPLAVRSAVTRLLRHGRAWPWRSFWWERPVYRRSPKEHRVQACRASRRGNGSADSPWGRVHGRGLVYLCQEESL